MIKDRIPKKYRWVFPMLILSALVVIYFTGIVGTIAKFVGYFVPLIAGACIAYVMNIPMKFFDRYLFPHAKKPIALKAKKVFLVTITFLLILGFVIFLFYLVVPSLKNTVGVFIKYLPSVYSQFQTWIVEHRSWFPDFAKMIEEYELDVNALVAIVTGFITDDTSNMLNSTFTVITSTFSGIYNTLMATIFSLYVLYNKKTLGQQVRRIARAYTPMKMHSKIDETLTTANRCFSAFIGGQCLQAVILGVLCFLLMTIFGFPEPAMISVFVGATSVIPLLGSYLGSIVGVMIVAALAPNLTFWYALFIFILQQFVASVIYPKVVGRSTGLPGMWVLSGVLVGGAMAGIVGMILGVPVTAILYQLLRDDVKRREDAKAVLDEEKKNDDPVEPSEETEIMDNPSEREEDDSPES